MTDRIIADSRHRIGGDILREILFQIIQRQLELVEYDILIRALLVRFFTVIEDMIEDLKELCLDQHLIPKLPVPLMRPQDTDQRGELLVQRMCDIDVFRHQQLAVIDRFQILFAAEIVSAAFQHRKAEQDIVIEAAVILMLSDRMDRLRMDQHEFSAADKVLRVPDRNTDGAFLHIDDLHLLMPVERKIAEPLRDKSPIDRERKIMRSVYFCFLICRHFTPHDWFVLKNSVFYASIILCKRI